MPVQADILMPAMIPTGSPLSVTAVGWTSLMRSTVCCWLNASSVGNVPLVHHITPSTVVRPNASGVAQIRAGGSCEPPR